MLLGTAPTFSKSLMFMTTSFCFSFFYFCGLCFLLQYPVQNGRSVQFKFQASNMVLTVTNAVIIRVRFYIISARCSCSERVISSACFSYNNSVKIDEA